MMGLVPLQVPWEDMGGHKKNVAIYTQEAGPHQEPNPLALLS